MTEEYVWVDAEPPLMRIAVPVDREVAKYLDTSCGCSGERIFYRFCCEKAKYGFAGKVKCLSCLKQRLIEDEEYKAVLDKIKRSGQGILKD